jgi:hypothetical protein
VNHLVNLIEAELLASQDASLARLDGWSGPYQSANEEGAYFFNATLGISSWDSPLVQVEFELGLRHQLLVDALLSADDEGTLDEELSPRLAFLSDKLKLPLHLLRRDVEDNVPPSPTSSSAYYSARSPHQSHRDPPPPVPNPC